VPSLAALPLCTLRLARMICPVHHRQAAPLLEPEHRSQHRTFSHHLISFRNTWLWEAAAQWHPGHPP
jgi:hypothetical protein